MSILNKLFNRKPVEKQQQVINMPDSISSGFTALLNNFYGADTSYKTSWIKNAIDVRAQNVANAQVYIVNKQTEEEIPNHPFIQVFNRTNVYDLSGIQLLDIISKNLDVYGNAYLYVAKTGTQPSELIPLPSRFVEPVYNSTYTLIIGYKYRNSGTVVTYNKDDIIHFRNISIDNYLVGVPVITALQPLIDIDNFQQSYSKMSLQNGGNISLALQTDAKLNGDVLERMRHEFKRNYTGSSNAGKVIVLDNGLQITDYSKNMKDMDYTEGRRLVRDEILSRMSVPPVLVGINDSANRATAEVEYSFFIQHTIKNIAKNITQTFDNYISKVYGEQYHFVLEYDSGISDSTLREYDLLLKYGIVTTNEVREYFNYSAITGGDELVQQPSVIKSITKATTVQSIIFSKEVFSSADACREWLRSHDFKVPAVDETETSYRFRQREPSEFVDGSFRTIELRNGVSAVIGTLKE